MSIVYTDIKYDLEFLDGPAGGSLETNTLISQFNNSYAFKTFDDSAIEIDPINGYGISSPLYLVNINGVPLTEYDIISTDSTNYRYIVDAYLNPNYNNISPDNPYGKQTIINYNVQNTYDIFWLYAIPDKNMFGITLSNGQDSINYTWFTKKFTETDIQSFDIIRLNDKIFIIHNNKLVLAKNINLNSLSLPDYVVPSLFIGTGNYETFNNYKLTEGSIVYILYIPIVQHDKTIMTGYDGSIYMPLSYKNIGATIDSDYYKDVLTPVYNPNIADDDLSMERLIFTQEEADRFIEVDGISLYNITQSNFGYYYTNNSIDISFDFYIDEATENQLTLVDNKSYTYGVKIYTQNDYIYILSYNNFWNIQVSEDTFLKGRVNNFRYTYGINQYNQMELYINNIPIFISAVNYVSYSYSPYYIGKTYTSQYQFTDLYITNLKIIFGNYPLYDSLTDIFDPPVLTGQYIDYSQLEYFINKQNLPINNNIANISIDEIPYLKYIESGDLQLYAISEGNPDHTLCLYHGNKLINESISSIFYSGLLNYTDYILKVKETNRIISLPIEPSFFTGYLSGTITYDATCGPTDLVVRCFKADTKEFIGEFPVINNNYRIDYLYYDKYYDVILVDKNRSIEQQVSSYRKPKIDIDVSVPETINLYIEYDVNNINVYIDIIKDIPVGNTYVTAIFDELILYYNNSMINISTIETNNYIPIKINKSSMYSYRVRLPNEKNNMSFCVRAKYNDTKSFSNIVTVNTANLINLTATMIE